MKNLSKTDWKRIDSLRDEDIDFSDIPPLDDEFFKRAVIWRGKKEQITLRLDGDVLIYFKHQGKGYQTAINAYFTQVHGSTPRRLIRKRYR